ncbi:MAG TPA: phosphoglucosamine mutase, partial [Pirellulaceae bacterium]|nr:phosphoglucosamine mutase [Pirellulaceae bacterium]
LESLACHVTILGEEPHGEFAHPPEPTASNLADISDHVSNNRYDVAFCQDPDADRLAIIDERGQYIGEEYTLALTLENRLSQQSGIVVTNCSTSRMALDIAAKYNSQCVTSAVGEANVADLMLARQAIYGGEGNGGPIDPRVGLVRDSFVGMAQILELMALRKQSISQLVSQLPTYHIVKSTIPIARENMGRLFELIEDATLNPPEGKSSQESPYASTGTLPLFQTTISRLDGLRVDWPDRWMLIRGSNTEPIVRVVAEARSVSDAQQLCNLAAELAAKLGDQA